MPSEEDLSEITSTAWSNVANGRGLNLFGDNRTYGQEGLEPTVFQYPLDMMLEKTDHLAIKIFNQIRSSETFSLPDPKSGENFNVTDLAGINNFTETFNQPDQQKKLEKNARFIFLPIPQQVSDAISVSYAEDTLNPLQVAGLSATADFINNPKQTVSKAGDIAKSIINGSALKDIDSNVKSAALAALSGQAINSFGANVNASSLISRASGQILQSNLELLFSGVTLRSFPLVYDFAPRDPKEAEVVKGIIRTLKKAMSPKKGKNPALFISAPDVFQLQYKTGNEDHPFLNMFKVCALSDMSVNYTASGTYATYGDASPVHIQVQMTFKEINPIYAEDYDDLSERGYKNVGY